MQATPSPAIDVEAIYRDHLDGIMRLLRRGFRYSSQGGSGFVRITSPFDVEDICQETFKEFMGQVDKGNFDRTRPPGPYLNRIAINVALQRLKKVNRETPAEVEEYAGSVEPDDPAEKEARLLAAEFRASLSGEERKVLEHCMIEGESQAKAGHALGMSRDQVYRTLQRVKRAAHGYFSDKGWFDDA